MDKTQGTEVPVMSANLASPVFKGGAVSCKSVQCYLLSRHYRYLIGQGI